MTYLTKQKTNILNLLKKYQDTSMSAKELLNKADFKISKATMYRELEALYASNTIQRYYNEAKNVYEYQYVITLNDCLHHLHLKCDICGKIYHLPAIKELSFSIDYAHSLIHGACNLCKEASL